MRHATCRARKKLLSRSQVRNGFYVEVLDEPGGSRVTRAGPVSVGSVHHVCGAGTFVCRQAARANGRAYRYRDVVEDDNGRDNLRHLLALRVREDRVGYGEMFTTHRLRVDAATVGEEPPRPKGHSVVDRMFDHPLFFSGRLFNDDNTPQVQDCVLLYDPPNHHDGGGVQCHYWDDAAGLEGSRTFKPMHLCLTTWACRVAPVGEYRLGRSMPVRREHASCAAVRPPAPTPALTPHSRICAGRDREHSLSLWT